jgi:hypothetical protein
MPLFAKEIVVLKDGVQAPSPVIQNPTVPVSKIQAKEFIVLGTVPKKEFVEPEPQYEKLQAKELVVLGSPPKKEFTKPEPQYAKIQAKEFIVLDDINTLPKVAAVRHPDFIEKSSDYVYHMFKD